MPTTVLRALRLTGVLLLLSVLPLRAQEREEILAYDATISVGDGGVMDVTEEITVRALGQDIRRGIYRDFPTSFPRSAGLGRIEAPFEVLEVRRDGRPEPYRVESIGGPFGRGGVRVRIGDADVMLEHGVHRYTIRYETSRWLDFGDGGRDRLYWNVTGNGWGFPIRHASARVRIPGTPDASDVRLEAWTGPEGSTASDARAAWDGSSSTAFFETTAPLAEEEGLTVRFSFPTGIVAPPSAEVREAWFRMDWGGWLDAGTLAGLVLSLYLLMWSRVGRDPGAAPLVVRYEPPEGFSPAALGYLARRGWSDALLSASLVSAAVKGALRIERDGRTWAIERRDEGEEEALAPEERKLRNDLLRGRTRLELKQRYHTRLRGAVKTLRRTLSRRLEKEYFVLNRLWFAAGAAVSLGGLGVLAWRDRYGIPPETWFLCVWLSFWTLGVGTLVVRVWRAWRSALGGGGIGSWGGAVFLSLFSLPFVGAEIVVGGLLVMRVPHHLLGAAATVGLLNVLFYHLLERPTLRGRGVLDRLDGFRAFLTATESDRLDRLHAPGRTPEVFERFLPFAIALGVENRWAERFQGVLAPQAAAGTATAGAVWYSAGSTADFSSMASSLGGAFSSSLSAASSPPSSSGGGGGGGSSGGGGGGGGGGGW